MGESCTEPTVDFLESVRGVLEALDEFSAAWYALPECVRDAICHDDSVDMIPVQVQDDSSESWLANPNIELKDLTWHEDDAGSYWKATAWNSDGAIGPTGTYYDIQENGKRLSRAEQKAELQRWGKL